MTLDFDDIFQNLEEHGWMLMAGVEPWTLTSLVSGEPIRGSWWGHDAGQRIFEIASRLTEHRDVESCRLVDRKVTFIHRRLWPALIAVGTSREPWQLTSLRPPDVLLLEEVEKADAGSNRKQAVGGLRGRELAAAGFRLETSLLVHGHQEHTEEGAHRKILESWSHWARRREVEPVGPRPCDARRLLEEAFTAGSGGVDPTGHLPWLRARAHRSHGVPSRP